MSNSMKIKIKKVISPCEFYFQFLEGEFKDCSRITLKQIEQQLRLIALKKQKIKNPQIGEVVACFMSKWNKYVRAKIIGFRDKNNFKLFLIDHCFYMNRNDIFAIPDELKIPTVQRGSLGLSLSQPDKWSEQALDLCKHLNSLNAETVHFIPICKKHDIFFGDIFVFTPSGNYSFTERLKSIERDCKSESNFDKIFEKMTNSVLYPKPLLPHKKIEIEPQLSLGSISDILFKENSFQPPSNLIIHGEKLKAPWTCINDSLFNQSIKKEIPPSFTDIQSYMWPQIHSSYRHAVIISSSESTSLLIPPLLNNIAQNPFRSNRPEYMGPIAIIFAHNSNKVKEIVKLCKSMVHDSKIIEAFGLCGDKKGDLICCDILVTTLPAFTRLTENIAVKIIDVNRLRYVAFSEIDRMMSSKHEYDLNRIARFCLNSDRDKIPQILITSRLLSNDIRKKFLVQLPSEKTVICMDSFLEAATFAGMEIKTQICDSFKVKVDYLMADGIEKNTVIIVKDEKCAELLKEALTDKKFDFSAIYIVTDSFIGNSCIENVENLIHFSWPTSQNVFMNRFKLMTPKIYEKLKGSEVKLATKILFEENNWAEFESFMNFMVARKVVKGNLEILEKIKSGREVIKCEKKIPLCKKLLQFGKCDEPSCPARHVLSENDKFDFFIGDYVKFNLISVESPINFVVEIKESCNNGKWFPYETKHEKLNDELQQYCEENLLNNLISGEGKIGSVYAKYDGNLKKWLRVKLIERTPSTVVKIYLMDQGSTAHANEIQLKKLTEDFLSLPPRVHKLQVFNLIPLDGQLYYDKSDTENLQAVIEKHSKNFTYICKVQFAFNDTLFTETFEAKNSKNVIKFSLKVTHLQLGLSEVDESIGVKLKELIGVDSQKEPEEQENHDLIKSNCLPTLVKAYDKKPVIENWKEVKYGKSISFTLKHYESPTSFFIIAESLENFVLKNWMTKIEKFVATEQMVDFSIGKTCLALINDVNKRAKILSIDEDQKVKLLLLDFGEVVSAESTVIFELPDELRSLSFQAVHCSILGIKPKFNMNFWPPMQKSKIKGLIESLDWSMNIIRKNLKQDELFSPMGINSYEVFLFNNKTQEYLHDIAVEKFYACADKSIENLMYNYPESDEEEIDLVSDFDESDNAPSICDSGHDESPRLKSESQSDLQPSFNLKGLQSLFELYQKKVETEFSKGEDSPCISETAMSDYYSQTSCESTELKLPTSQLTNLFLHPHIEWRQNEIYLYLIIKAQDCKDYSLEINEFGVDIIIEYHERNFERGVLQLYGAIIPQKCSHDFNGANIILRLVKRKEKEWSRLSQQKIASAYIKYSEEDVPFILIEETPKYSYLPAGFYSDEEESDDNDYEGKEFQCLSDDE